MRFLFIVMLFAFVSCQKSNINDHPDFVGTWKAYTNDASYEIIVNESGKATYEKITSNTETTARGKLVVEGDSKVKIGLISFSMEEYPAYDSTTTWTMTL